MKIKLKKIYFVFFTILTLFLSSCQVEENAVTNDLKSDNYNVKNISKDEIDSNSKISEKLQKFTQKNNAASKNIGVKDLGIIIQTDGAKYIENGAYHSYTFSTLQEDNENIKNVLFSLNENKEYDAYLVEYDYNKIDLLSFNNLKKPGQVAITPIKLDLKSLTARQSTVYACAYTYLYIDKGDLVGADNLRYEWVLKTVSCQYYTSQTPEAYHGTNYSTGTTSTYTNYTASGGGSVATSPKVSMYDQSELMKINAVKTAINAGGQQTRFLDSHGAISFAFFDYLAVNKFSEETISFTKELLNVVVNEKTVDLNAFKFVLNAKASNKFNTGLDDAFFLSVDNYMDADMADIYGKDPDLIIYFGVHHITKTLRLKKLNPEWSYLKCYWEASKEVVHITLDVFGMVPVIGELADITNGVLYTIEGDGINATLSYASAVPFAGWALITTKYAFKLKVIPKTVYTISNKTKLVWQVTGNNITFGSSSQLRVVLGLGPIVHDSRQAHHIIPWAKAISGHPVVQKAAKSGSAFHMNEELNGIAVAAWRNQSNHSNYNNLILSKLTNFQKANPNALPIECYNQLIIIVNQAKKAIIDNPNVHLNNLIF